MHPVHTFPPCFPKIHSNIILPSMSSLPSGFFSSGFQTKILYSFPISPVHVTCPHLIIFDMIAPVILRRLPQEYTASEHEDGGSMVLRNVGILPQHYTASQPRRPRLESTSSWKVRSRIIGWLTLWSFIDTVSIWEAAEYRMRLLYEERQRVEKLVRGGRGLFERTKHQRLQQPYMLSYSVSP
jgi:hypothetical protein